MHVLLHLRNTARIYLICVHLILALSPQLSPLQAAPNDQTEEDFPTSASSIEEVKAALLGPADISLKRYLVYSIIPLDRFIDLLFDAEVHKHPQVSRMIVYALAISPLQSTLAREEVLNRWMIVSMLNIFASKAYDHEIRPKLDDISIVESTSKLKLAKPNQVPIILLDILNDIVRSHLELLPLFVANFDIDVLMKNNTRIGFGKEEARRLCNIIDAINLIYTLEPLRARQIFLRIDPYFKDLSSRLHIISPRQSDEIILRLAEVRHMVLDDAKLPGEELLAQTEKRARRLLAQSDTPSIKIGIKLLDEIYIYEIETIVQLIRTAENFPELKNSIYANLALKTNEGQVLDIGISMGKMDTSLKTACQKILKRKYTLENAK